MRKSRPRRDLAWLKIALYYALFGAAWILFSDQAVQVMSGEPPGPVTIMQSLKGLLFIAITTVLLAVLIRRHLKKLAESRTALRESEMYFRTMFEQASDCFLLADVAGRFVDVNPSGRRLLGYDREEFLALRVSDIHPEKDHARLRTIYAKIVSGETHRGVWDLKRKDGSLVPVELAARRLENGMLLAVARNISVRRKAENALRKAMRKATAASKAKSEFLANMSHEIRTPLNGVMGLLQVMLQADPATPPRREYLEMALGSSRRLLALLNDLLDLSRIEAGKMQVQIAPFDPGELARSTAALFRREAEVKGLALHCVVEGEDAGPLMGDEVRLRQILLNLVGNAVKYTERGEARILVRTVLSPHKPEAPGATNAADMEDAKSARLVFEVSDTGIGIPDDKKEIIFQSFTQADSGKSRRFGGAGLGLAIVRRTVDLLGGELVLESREGEGATFRASFDLDLPPAPEAGAQPRGGSAGQGGKRRDGTNPLRTLLVEDDAINQLAVKIHLDKLGHATTVASNGQEALDALERQSFDLVLMDIHMPVMDGLEAVKRLRASGKPYANVFVAALTAHAMAGDRERFLAAGMDAYLPKPVDFEALEDLLARAAATRSP